MIRPPSFPPLRRFLRDQRGLAAVEFAMILPFMAVLYFGSIEILMFVTVERKVSQAVSTLSELVARNDGVGVVEMDNIFAATLDQLEPYPTEFAQLRVTSIFENDGSAEVDWSRGYLLAGHSAGSPLSVPEGILSENGSVIFAEVVYPYTPALDFLQRGGIQLSRTIYLRPRTAARVPWTD